MLYTDCREKTTWPFIAKGKCRSKFSTVRVHCLTLEAHYKSVGGGGGREKEDF